MLPPSKACSRAAANMPRPPASSTRSTTTWFGRNRERPARVRTAPTSVLALLVEVSRLHHLGVAPDRVLLAVVEIMVGDLLEQRVLRRFLLDHLEPRLLEGGEVLVAPALDLHLVLVAHL